MANSAQQTTEYTYMYSSCSSSDMNEFWINVIAYEVLNSGL
jgi:hypothetical protein